MIRKSATAAGAATDRYRQHICDASSIGRDTDLALRFRCSRPEERYVPGANRDSHHYANEQRLLTDFVNEVINSLSADAESAGPAAGKRLPTSPSA